MFKRPTSRRKTIHREVQLNLVPILDTMVTLIAFLLFTMSFLQIVSIESPFPQASPKEVEKKLKEKPLQLTLTMRQGEVELWSPFELIQPKVIKDQLAGTPDVKAIHAALLEIKRRFPTETQVVFVPTAGVNYDTLISVMDSTRMVEPGDEPIYFKNPATDRDEVAKALFPEIVFGNLLGDS